MARRNAKVFHPAPTSDEQPPHARSPAGSRHPARAIGTCAGCGPYGDRQELLGERITLHIDGKHFIQKPFGPADLPDRVKQTAARRGP